MEYNSTIDICSSFLLYLKLNVIDSVSLSEVILYDIKNLSMYSLINESLYFLPKNSEK